jgi:hypothetical protein
MWASILAGHPVTYFSKLCKSEDSSRGPRVELCKEGMEEGVLISVSPHYKNAYWVAVPGYQFAFTGAVADGLNIHQDLKREAVDKSIDLKIYEGLIPSDAYKTFYRKQI